MWWIRFLLVFAVFFDYNVPYLLQRTDASSPRGANAPDTHIAANKQYASHTKSVRKAGTRHRPSHDETKDFVSTELNPAC